MVITFDVLSRDFAHTPFVFLLVSTVGSPLVLSSTSIDLRFGGGEKILVGRGEFYPDNFNPFAGFKSHASEEKLHIERRRFFNARCGIGYHIVP